MKTDKTKKKILRALKGKEAIKTDLEHFEQNEVSPQRDLAINIIEEFENLLEDNDLTIPDRDREKGNEEEEGRIYGLTYYSLEDKVTELVEKFLKEEGVL